MKKERKKKYIQRGEKQGKNTELRQTERVDSLPKATNPNATSTVAKGCNLRNVAGTPPIEKPYIQ